MLGAAAYEPAVWSPAAPFRDGVQACAYNKVTMALGNIAAVDVDDEGQPAATRYIDSCFIDC